MLLGLLIVAVALQARAWGRLRSRVAAGEITRVGGSLRYAGWALAPLLLFVGAFLGFVGLEELSGEAMISEPMGRAALPIAALLLGVGGLGWVGFSISCAVIGGVPGGKS